MENIENIVLDEISKLIEKGIKPKYIYLGREEIATMSEYIYRKYGMTLRMDYHPELFGLKLIEVKAESHFNVC